MWLDRTGVSWRDLPGERYEKREANYLAMVTIAAIVLLWLE